MTQILLQIQQLNLKKPEDISSIKKDIEYLRRAKRDIQKKIDALENKIQNQIVSETVINHWEEFFRTQSDEKVSESLEDNCQKYDLTGDCFNLNIALAAHRVQISRKSERAAA